MDEMVGARSQVSLDSELQNLVQALPPITRPQQHILAMCAQRAQTNGSTGLLDYFLSIHQSRDGYLNAADKNKEMAAVFSIHGCALLANVLGKSIREGNNDFSNLLHTGYDFLCQLSEFADPAMPEDGRLYCNLSGKGGLTVRDPDWQYITMPDEAGFCGFTTFTPVTAEKPERHMFCEEGFLSWDGETQSRILQNSDLVCFQCAPSDASGHHSCIRCCDFTHHNPESGDITFMFPPMTLFSLIDVLESFSVCGVAVKRRLLVVRATFLRHIPLDEAQADVVIGKYGSSRQSLLFGGRKSYIEGIDRLLSEPVLTMEQEWLRDDAWVDWKGGEYQAADAWKYVTGAAKADKHSGRECWDKEGTRTNDGMTPCDFLAAANDEIQKMSLASKVNQLFVALLTMNELLALRLYTGPGYNPINEFCREVFKLSPHFRMKVAKAKDVTYAATVRHLCNAIRKLARFNIRSIGVLHYRSLRGRLPDSFFHDWQHDQSKMQCAVDFGFMSCSTDVSMSKKFMDQNGPNVLWNVHCSRESDSAMHTGASVSVVSQFPGEEEVLFPPCTMLRVERPMSKAPNPHALPGAVSRSSYTEIDVIPCFC
jgi:hypothetical protein